MQSPASPPRVAVVGVGQELNGDDAAGVLAARALLNYQQVKGTLVPKGLSSRHANDRAVPSIAADRKKLFWNQRPLFLVIEAAHAPENCTGAIRRFAPDLVILVDAAEMGDQPGTVRWLDWRETGGRDASTHTLSLCTLATYLAAELACDVGLIGIQPRDTSLGAPVSSAVRRAARAVGQGLGALLLRE